MSGRSWRLWGARRVIILWMFRRFSGRRSPATKGIFPPKKRFYTFLEQALCLFNEETNYRSSLSPFGIKMADRVSGIPIHLDISDYPMKKGWISNRNRVVIGPSGGGKSFILNHICRQYYEQGAHIVIVDTGNSYQGLCSTYPAENQRSGWNIFHLSGGCPRCLQPLLCRRRSVRRREARIAQGAVADFVEARNPRNRHVRKRWPCRMP